MSNRGALVALFALLVLAARAPAIAADARIITFDEAVRIGLEQNSDLKQAQIASKTDDVAVAQARGRFYPDLTLSSRGAQSFGRNFNEEEGRVIDTRTRTVNLALSSSVTLFDGFGNTAGLKEAELSAQGGKQDLQRSRETVVFTVASNYLALVQAQEELRVRRESLASESALEQQIANYVDAGARTIADLYQQQASVASARLAVVQAERAAQLAESDLIATLQLDPAGSYQFERPGYDAARLAVDLPDLDRMLASAYAQRIDLRAEETRVEAARQAVRVAKSGRWPIVSLSSSYGSNYTDQSDFGLLDQFDQRRGGSIGLGFAVPLFDRGDTRAAIRRAELQADSAEVALDTHRHQVGLDVRTAYQDFRTAREQLSSAEAQVKAADLALQAAQERYEAGAATLVELTQARTTHVEAASALINAKSNLIFQRTLVDYFSGALEVPAAGD
jgi:outer membrane protein